MIGRAAGIEAGRARVAITIAIVLGILAAPAGAAPVPAPVCCVTSERPTALAVAGSTAYVGGSFRHVGRATGGLGVLDTDEGHEARQWPQVKGSVDAAVPDGAGGWYVAGEFSAIGNSSRTGLAHLRADGTVDPAWAPTLDGRVRAMALSGGVVWIGGSFTHINGDVARDNLAGLDAVTGAPAGPALGVRDTASGNARVYALVVRSFIRGTPSGPVTIRQLYVGGSFDRAGADVRHNLAAFDLSDGTTTSFDPEPNDMVMTLAMSPTVLYVGGYFTAVGSTARAYLTALQPGTGADAGWPTVVDGSVGSIAYAPAVAATAGAPARPATVYLAGVFTHVTRNTPVARSRLASVDAQTGEVQDWAPPLAGVSRLGVVGDSVYLAGHFDAPTPAGQRTNLAAVEAGGTGAFTAWDPDAEIPGPYSATLVVDPVSRTVLVGGSFDTVGGEERRGIAAIDLRTGRLTSFDPDVDGAVDALLATGDTLYAGGSFSTVNGGVTRSQLAAFARETGTATAFDAKLTGGVVTSLALAGDHVFAGGGSFQVNGTVPRHHLAAFDSRTGAVLPFQLPTNGVVQALASAGPTVYVAGDFDTVGGIPRSHLAAVEERAGTAGVVLPFDPNPNFSPSALAVDGSTLYATGNLSTVNAGVARNGGAAVDRVTGVATAWNPAVAPFGVAPTQDGVFVGGGAAHSARLDALTGGALPFDAGLDHDAGFVAASPEAGLVLAGGGLGFGIAGWLAHYALTPAAPAAPTATAGDGQASVSFAAPPDGGAPVSSYAVTASPGGRTASGTGSPISVTGLDDGTAYTFTVAATNAAGTGRASAPSDAVTPSAPPVAGGGGEGGGAAGAAGHGAGAAADTVPPVLSGLSATPRRFKRSTSLAFSLSEAATVTVTVTRRLSGRRRGRACIKPRRGLKQSCTRLQMIARLTGVRTAAGRNRVPFTARLAGRALKPGSYALTLVATDAAGNPAKPAAVTVTVLRP